MPNTADEAEQALKKAFTAQRAKFLDAMEAAFNQRKVSPERFDATRFQQFVRVHQRQNRWFPVSTNLARLWATGETDLEVQLDWTARLRAAQSNYIRGDNLPASSKIGPTRVVMINPPDLPVEPSAAMLLLGTNVNRTNIVSLNRARQNFQAGFTGESQNLGKFLASFLRENCRYDEKLTVGYRFERTQRLFAADTYEPGHTLVQSGAVVTARTRAALGELRVRSVPNALQAEIQRERTRANTALAQLDAQLAIRNREQTYKWALAGVSGALLIAIFLLLRRSARPATTALVPADNGPQLDCPTCSPSIAIAARSTDSEQLKAAMVPHFARWLASKVFRKLMWQRVYLLETQQQAEAELRELESRLIAMQAPIQERLAAYENRVAELEKQLATAREESRQLIRSQIAILQKKLESERANHPDLN